ncbi:MAG: hypothetical protein KME23_02885 [Goleter apudmare HA4340-LM2]|jgi:hypothetical protein|nr:hypothetical protein [Goleter apudmare HA4340-LM2]
MKLIKKSEKLLLEKIKIMEETEEENLQVDLIDAPEPAVEVELRTPNYFHWRDQQIIRSVGNSGWQVSEIWKDVRLDDFSSR